MVEEASDQSPAGENPSDQFDAGDGASDDESADAGIEFVRPFAYVEPYPVVRRIGDRDLYLGNVHAAQPDATDESFANVLSLTEDAQPSTTHHRGFPDSEDHDYRAFADAVDDAIALQNVDGPTLVHCTAGVSRSSTVLATAIAATEDRSFRDALAAVEAARPAAVPNPALVESAVVYLAARN